MKFRWQENATVNLNVPKSEDCKTIFAKAAVFHDVDVAIN